MTAKEAIQTIEAAKAEIEWNYPLDYAAAFEVAIEVLEKQIPKNLIGKTDPMFGDSYIVCPNCENTVIVNPFTHSIFKHCPNCGQALDWSETK